MKNKRTWAYQWTCWIGRDQQSSLSLTPSPALDSPKGLCTGTHHMPGSICCGSRLTNTLTHCIWNLDTHKYIYFLTFLLDFLANWLDYNQIISLTISLSIYFNDPGQNSFGFYVLLAQLMKENVSNNHLPFCPSQFSVRRSTLSLQLYR